MALLAEAVSLATGAADQPLTPARLRECHHCGQLQVMPAMPPSVRAVCLRCEGVLRHTHRDPIGLPLALNLTALVLFCIAVGGSLISVSRAGQARSATLFTGPIELEQYGTWALSAVVLFTTLAAPIGKLLATTWVLLGILIKRPRRELRLLFAWVLPLRPWSMIEVYLLAAFVAFQRLGAQAHIDLGVSLYALAALMLAMVAADAELDPETVWDAIGRRHMATVSDRMAARHPEARRIGCGACRFVSRTVPGSHCPRCGAVLVARKPNSVARTWALGTAALILYLPANAYPVLTFTQLGFSHPSTILGGVRELLDAGMWPLAALVFFASIIVPGMKIIGLAILLLTTHAKSRRGLRDRTRLYRIIDQIGRWSMIDIFIGSLLVALLQFGKLATVVPGPGAIAFAAVVILTMLAAQSFDPRLMWDAAGVPSGELDL